MTPEQSYEYWRETFAAEDGLAGDDHYLPELDLARPTAGWDSFATDPGANPFIWLAAAKDRHLREREAAYRNAHDQFYGEYPTPRLAEEDRPSRAHALAVWAVLITACLAFWVLVAWVAAGIAQAVV